MHTYTLHGVLDIGQPLLRQDPGKKPDVLKAIAEDEKGNVIVLYIEVGNGKPPGAGSIIKSSELPPVLNLSQIQIEKHVEYTVNPQLVSHLLQKKRRA